MKYLYILLFSASLISCSNPKQEQKLEALDQKSAREVTLMTEKKGDTVYHITRQNIWFNGEKIATQSDTIVTPNQVKTWNNSDSAKTLSEVPIFVTVQ